MEAPAVPGEQVRYDMDQGYPQGYTQQEVDGKYCLNKNVKKSFLDNILNMIKFYVRYIKI